MSLLLAALLAQELPFEEIAAKAGGQLTWLDDGRAVLDQEGRGKRPAPERPSIEVFEEAKKKAAEQGRMILWYAPRIEGGHMYRPALPDGYARQLLFSHPEVVALLERKFVLMRATADKALADATGIHAFDAVEPAIILVAPDGTVLHVIERIRTFNADWLIETLRGQLARHSKYNPAPGKSVEEMILGGDYEAALRENPKAYLSAVLARRMRRGEEALGLAKKAKEPEADVEAGRVLLAMNRIDEAKKSLAGGLKSKRGDEALYYLGLAEYWTGGDPDDRWRELIGKHPDSPWAARAAVNFVKDVDTYRKGGSVHGFEDVFWAPDEAYAGLRGTRLPRDRKDVADVARRGVEFLLRAQRADGGWTDSRYCYWPNQEITPNVWVAATALAATALLEYRDLAPERIDAALAKAEQYLADDKHLNPGKNEECYAQSFKLLYYLKRGDKEKVAATARLLGALQDADGWFSHEYPNPFATAAGLHALEEAVAAGVDVDSALITKAADALESTRGEGGAQAYSKGRPPSGLKDSMARIVQCDSTLLRADRLTLNDVRNAFDTFWRYRDNLETIRVCDFHSDGELGGFFVLHSLFFTSEAIRVLPDEERVEHYNALKDWLLAIPEFDGSFLDSHELGKSYGTAMGLLTLKNCVERR